MISCVLLRQQVTILSLQLDHQPDKFDKSGPFRLHS